MHISDGEFLLARAYNRNIDRTVDDANTIIAAKNRRLNELASEVVRLRQELEAERGKRKMAEFQLLRRH